MVQVIIGEGICVNTGASKSIFQLLLLLFAVCLCSKARSSKVPPQARKVSCCWSDFFLTGFHHVVSVICYWLLTVITVVVITAVVDWQEVWRCLTWCSGLMENVVDGKYQEIGQFSLCELMKLDTRDSDDK